MPDVKRTDSVWRFCLCWARAWAQQRHWTIVISGSWTRKERGRWSGGEGASSICACYCHLCVLFLFSFAFLTQPFFQQSLLAKLSIPGSPSGFGAAVSTFLAISVATETIQSSPANAPRRAFSFCYLCIWHFAQVLLTFGQFFQWPATPTPKLTQGHCCWAVCVCCLCVWGVS